MIVFTIIILSLVQLITTLEMSMVMPLAPIIGESFSIDPSIVATLNLGFTLSGLLTPLFGYSADKNGIKKILVINLLLFSIGCLIVSFNSIQYYVIGRFLLGIGYFCMSSIITSYTTKLVDKNKLGLVSGIYKIAFSLGLLLSPQVSVFLTKYFHFTKIYLFLSIISIIMMLISFSFRDFKSDENSISIKDIFSIFKDKKAKLYFLASFTLSIPSVYFYSFTSVYLSDLGYSQVWISNLYSFIALGSIVGGIIIVFFADKVGMNKLSVFSTLFGGILLIIMIITKNWYYVGFLFGVCYDTIWGLFYPVGSMFYKYKTSTFLTILGLMLSFTNSFTNITGPYLYNLGGYTLLVLISGISLILSSLFMYLAMKLAFNKF